MLAVRLTGAKDDRSPVLQQAGTSFPFSNSIWRLGHDSSPEPVLETFTKLRLGLRYGQLFLSGCSSSSHCSRIGALNKAFDAARR